MRRARRSALCGWVAVVLSPRARGGRLGTQRPDGKPRLVSPAWRDRRGGRVPGRQGGERSFCRVPGMTSCLKASLQHSGPRWRGGACVVGGWPHVGRLGSWDWAAAESSQKNLHPRPAGCEEAPCPLCHGMGEKSQAPQGPGAGGQLRVELSKAAGCPGREAGTPRSQEEQVGQTPRGLSPVPTPVLASVGSRQTGGAQSAPGVVPSPSWQSVPGAGVCTGRR